MAAEYNFAEIIESRFPGLLQRVRRVIQASEKAYEGSGASSDSFLWEHTLQVASIACRLAQEEKIDPLIPAIAALFHDAGKFAGGKYHKEDAIEEEESARIAERLLRRSPMKPSDTRKVLAGLRALYNEKARKNRIAAVLHDADFLSKFGALGVAGFFTKSVLRGHTLRSSVIGYLSKELTYAACLPGNMRTQAGRRLAARKAADSIKFYRALLAELRESRIADLKIRRIRVAYPSSARRSIDVHFVISPACPKCGSEWDMAWTTDRGVKCSRLNINWACTHCGEQVETSFCLPEIA